MYCAQEQENIEKSFSRLFCLLNKHSMVYRTLKLVLVLIKLQEFFVYIKSRSFASLMYRTLCKKLVSVSY